MIKFPKNCPCCGSRYEPDESAYRNNDYVTMECERCTACGSWVYATGFKPKGHVYEKCLTKAQVRHNINNAKVIDLPSSNPMGTLTVRKSFFHPDSEARAKKAELERAEDNRRQERNRLIRLAAARLVADFDTIVPQHSTPKRIHPKHYGNDISKLYLDWQVVIDRLVDDIKREECAKRNAEILREEILYICKVIGLWLIGIVVLVAGCYLIYLGALYVLGVVVGFIKTLHTFFIVEENWIFAVFIAVFWSIISYCRSD